MSGDHAVRGKVDARNGLSIRPRGSLRLIGVGLREREQARERNGSAVAKADPTLSLTALHLSGSPGRG